MGHLVLVGTVVVHDPDFFVAAAVAHKIDLALRNARDTSAEAEDDFISELVGGGTGGVGGGGIGVLLAEHLRGADIFHVVEPAMHDHAGAGRTQIAESQHGCVGRRSIPGFETHFGRIARSFAAGKSSSRPSRRCQRCRGRSRACR